MNPSYRSRGGYRTGASLRPLGNIARIGRPMMTALSETRHRTKDELREILAEACRNTAKPSADGGDTA